MSWLSGAAAEAPLALRMPAFSSDAYRYKTIQDAAVHTVRNTNDKSQRLPPDDNYIIDNYTFVREHHKHTEQIKSTELYRHVGTSSAC